MKLAKIILGLSWLGVWSVSHAADCTVDQLKKDAALNESTATPDVLACKVELKTIVSTLAKVGVYNQEGTWICDLSSNSEISVTTLNNTSVIACDTALGLVAVKLGDKQFWVDRNAVRLPGGKEKICANTVGKAGAPPRVSVGAGQSCVE